jgi:hypothetical protein
MTDQPSATGQKLSRQEISDRVTGLGWRYNLGLIRTSIKVGSIAQAADVARLSRLSPPRTATACRPICARTRQEARRRGQPRGPEHILLGLISERDGVAARALERLGISRALVRQQAGRIAGQARRRARPGRPPIPRRPGGYGTP